MKGSYLLIIKLKDYKRIRVGKNNNILFSKGFYIYVGSALNGLEQRINRHLRISKKIHWHIDYFLRYVKIVEILYKENTIREECIIAKKLEKKLSLIPSFGCNDCQCKSHLFHGSFKEVTSAVEKLQMNSYPLYEKT